MDPLGKSPVPIPILVLGKLSMAGSWSFFVPGWMGGSAMLFDSALTRGIGVLMAAVGLLVFILGIVHLGKSVSVGLPGEMTELRTRGIYRVTRNPIYLGGFLMCIGSCLFSVHPVNLVLCAITIGIHHRIVMREEEFLQERFGHAWVNYRQRVPRYFGWIGR